MGTVTKVAVIDVGSNTVRLLIASVGARSLTALVERKAWLQLGADVALRGSISEMKLAAAARAVTAFAAEAHGNGCQRLEVLVASPGRQAENGDELLARLEDAAASVRVLSREEEASIAFLGATAGHSGAERIAIVDVGGGSTQLAVGFPDSVPEWVCSLDVGSIRLAAGAFGTDPPGKQGIRKSKQLLQEHFAGFAPPTAQRLLAVGGSARALFRLARSPSLDADQLRWLTRLLRKSPSSLLASRYGIARERSRNLAAGAVILAEVQKQLGLSLLAAHGGLREGAALMLATEKPAA
ncbi:MAG: hypothetical protein C5B48_09240 [Candidatus Rokuibacteriota bacterium]|nr:MAG: hypothetical protein C5B48_09240 [Candidatus Rokubacteria bacterium]